MTEVINVFLITGFLGSGKTTFLNRIIHQFPKDSKLMILMNEFGEVGIDGTLVDMEELDVLEINKGSIFCACVKTDFIKGLFEIAGKIRPEVLLMESTGVANPTDLKKDLALPIFKDSFKLREQFCIVDADKFLDEFQVFASVESQIASSSRFIINKTDLAPAKKVEEIKRLIGNYHQEPVFYEAAYCDIDVAGLLCLEPTGEKIPGAVLNMTGEELDSFIDGLLDDPQASLSPPDILMSATFLWQGAELSEIEEMTGKLPGGVVRAKGFLIAGDTYLYSFVMGRCSIEKKGLSLKESQKNVLVVISPPHVMPEVERVMKRFGLAKLGKLTPGLSLKK